MLYKAVPPQFQALLGSGEAQRWAGIALPSPFDARRLDLAPWTTAARPFKWHRGEKGYDA